MSSYVSDEMSSYSGSPASYTTLESPNSSPLQQVPEIATTITGLLCDKKLFKFRGNGEKPYLKITEQPQNHFRFRYDKEKSGSSHGCLLGKSFVERKVTEKTYPTVQLINFFGNAVIKCAIKYKNTKKELQKAYKILEDTYASKEFNVPKYKSYQVGFPGIGVDTIKKSDLATLLYANLSEKLPKNKPFDVKKLRVQCDNLAKSMNLNIVCLEFRAHDVDTGKEICERVLSDPICNKKNPSTNALKICRVSMYSGRSKGQEDIFLLVDKIDKKDIEVHFYEEDTEGNRSWYAKGVFIPNDVHYQCVIVCRTPPYINPETEVDVKVFIELVRPSDGSTSPPQAFLYKADPTHKQIKRRKTARPYPIWNFTDNTSNNDVAATNTLASDTQSLMVQNKIPQQVSAPESEWDNIISSAIGTILDVHPGQTMKPLGMVERQGLMNPQNIMEQKGPTESHEAMESQGLVEDFEITEYSGVMNSQGVIELHELVESQVALGPQAGIVLHEATELQGSMESEEMVNSQRTAVSPMWGQQQINYQPEARVGTLLPSAQYPPADFSTMSVAMEDDPMSENFFEVYADLFDVFFENNDLSGTGGNRISLVSDSGRVKVEVRSSSTQTYNDTSDTNQGSDNDENFDGVEPQGPIRVCVSQARERANESSGANRAARVLTEEDETVKDNESASALENEKAECSKEITRTVVNEGESGFTRVRVNDDKDAGKGEGTGIETECEKTSTDENESLASKRGELKDKASQNSAGASKDKVGKSEITNNSADDDYPALFTPKDAAEVKKLVCELCEMVRDKRSTVTSAVREKLYRLFDIRLSNGDTFLHMTLFKSQRSFESLVKIAHNAKMSHLLNYSNNRGETILHLALVHGDPDVVSLLVDKGCDPMSRTIDEETCVHYGVRYGSEPTMRALLDTSARRGVSLDLDALNAERYTALHLCALEGNGPFAALLAAHGARLSLCDNAGRNPLHLCAYDAKLQVARALLPHATAADVNAEDSCGRTPLQVVCLRTPLDVVMAELLLSSGAHAHASVCDHPELQAALRRHVPRDQLAALYQLREDFKSDSDTADNTGDEYESADDESVDVTPESLASRLHDLDLFDDAETTPVTSC